MARRLTRGVTECNQSTEENRWLAQDELSDFPDLPYASSVGSLFHATLPICVRRSVVCISNMSTFRAFPSLSVSLCLLARLYTAIHRPPAQTHLSTRVFHSGSGAGLHPWIIQLSQRRIYKHYGGS